MRIFFPFGRWAERKKLKAQIFSFTLINMDEKISKKCEKKRGESCKAAIARGPLGLIHVSAILFRKILRSGFVDTFNSMGTDFVPLGSGIVDP